jgi:WD40 repeat protein
MDTYPRILIAVLATLALLGGCGPVGPTQEPALDGSTAQGAPVGAEQGAEARATNVEPIQVPSPKVGGGAVPSNKNSLDGHDPRVAGLAFLEGGDRLASAGCIFSLKLWDVTSGQEMGSPVVLGGRAYALSFSPDGGLVAVGDAQKRIQLWDVKTGQQRGSLRGHGTYVMSLTFSPDGRLLASAGDDNSIKIWDIESGQEIHDLMGHITPVTALAFSPDGSLLASGSVQFSTTIMLWDVASGEARRTLVDHTDNINDLAFSPDGTLLASASADRTARIWRVKSGQVLHTLTGQSDPVYALAFSPDGTLLATSGDDGGIRLWDVKAGQEIRTLGGHNESVFYLVFSPDGSRLASGGVDGTVLLRVLGAAEEAEPVALQRPVPQAASPVPVSDRSLSKGQAQGTIAFASYREGESKIFLMNVDGSNVTPVSRTGLRESRPAWSPDGSRIAYVRRMNNANHEIYVMNADGSGATQLTNRPDSVESEPSWSPDGQRIAFISNERPTANTLVGRFHVWVMNADGSDQMLLTDIGGSNTSPDWSPDGQRLVFDSTRDGDHEIYVMDANGGHLVNLTQHPAMDYSPTWSPDGTRIAFVSDRHGDEEIYVMGADGSDPVRLTDHPGFDKAPTWSPDGQYLAFYSRRVAFNTEVYRMRADGTEQVRLTDDADFDGFPVWQPSAAVAGLQVAEGSAPFETDTGLDSQASLASLSALEGLPPDQFFEESFELLMLRDPEWVSSEGLAGHFGTGHSQLTDLSDAYRRETQQMQAAILDMLRAYDREQLGREQQISYDIYEWYLDDQVRGQEFMYHDFPVTHFVTSSSSFSPTCIPSPAARTPRSTSPAWNRWTGNSRVWWRACNCGPTRV